MTLLSGEKESSLPNPIGPLDSEVKDLLASFLPYFNDTPLHTPSSLLPHSHIILPLKIDAYAKKLKEMDNIVKVDNHFKMLNEFEPGSEAVSAVRLTVDKYNTLLKGITFASLQTSESTNRNRFLISFQLKNANKLYFYVKEDKDNCIKNYLNAIVDLLPSIHIERKSRKHIRKSMPHLKTRYWGKKETGKEWDQHKDTRNYYKYVVHPLIMDLFEHHILTMKNPPNPLLILDVGGGKGELALKLIQLSQSHSIPIHYLLLEPNPYQAEIATQRFSQLATQSKTKAQFSTQVICGDLEDFYLQNKEGRNKMHCIISSGGPLSEQVASYQQAKDNVLMMRDLLMPGGKIIASGFTHLLISKKKFIQNKLTVLNTVKKLDGLGYHGIVQAYVCEKPAKMMNGFFKTATNPTKKPNEGNDLACRFM